ncbi:hypothetical protein K4F52_003329 [Lecanicillium sp. MT-2017a]|nr:hypothetical protein K4F52_003329 [Lecanicillium sp. MT-2017a]
MPQKPRKSPNTGGHKCNAEPISADDGEEKPCVKKNEKATPKPPNTKNGRSEEQEWIDRWGRCTGQWKYLDEDPGVKDVKVPWPTKSGKLGDVNEENIREFFSQGLQLEQISGESALQTMNLEDKRWHTDKIVSRFGCEILVGEHKDALNTITRAVIELWKQTKVRKSKV